MDGHEIQLIPLWNKKISSCLGCFGCWVKTPGVCIVDDEGREVAKRVIQSDLVIAVSSITFGDYSYEFKKALDRMLPNISPFFKKIKGEGHHRPRYKKYPNWLSIGLLSEENETMADIFRNLVARNAINIQNKVSCCCIVDQAKSLEAIWDIINKGLKEVGVAHG